MKPVIALCAAFSVVSGAAQAASSLLFVSNIPAPNATAASSYTLPTGTNTDWGYFNQLGTPDPTVTSFSATNTSTADTRNFTVTALNGGSVRGPGNLITGAPHSYFDFDNGDPSASVIGTGVRPSGIFNSQLGSDGATANAGLSLLLSGFSTQSLIQLWTYGYNVTGTLQAYVDGSLVSSYSLTDIVSENPGDGKTARIFTFDFTPESTSSSVEFRYFMTSASVDTSYAHVGFQAVAISPIPEPTTALLGLLTLPLLVRRRR